MHLFIQACILGLLAGGVYALMASGLTLAFGVMRVINVAQGAMIVLGAFLSYTLFTKLHIDPFVSVVLLTPLMFLVGVIFLLYRLKDVVQYVSLFTIGHSITLLAGVLGGIQANSYVIDAIIGLSVVYKAFENMGGFDRLLGFRPNARMAVMTFGLFHGFGLATKLQEFTMSRNGLVTNIVSFNAGVEVGQVLALTGVLIAICYSRRHAGFLRHSFAANTLLAGAFTASVELEPVDVPESTDASAEDPEPATVAGESA